MAKKTKQRRKKQAEHTHLGIAIDHYDVRVHAGINLQLIGSASIDFQNQEPVYVFGTTIDLNGRCISPADRAGDRYDIRLYGESGSSPKLEAKVADLRKRNKEGEIQYRKRASGMHPIYEDPPPLAYLEKVRGEPRWNAWVWVAAQLVSDCLQVLQLNKQSYVHINERKIDRQRQIRSLSIQTVDPQDD